MKKWIVLGCMGLFLAFEFQNCEQGKMTTASGTLPTDSQISLAPAGSNGNAELSFPKIEAVDSFSPDRILNYRINLATQKFRLLDRRSQLSEQDYCLSTAEANELSDIIAAAKICAPKSPKSGEICAEVYIPPYARIIGGQEVLVLGESVSSCSKGPDLCGDLSDKLKNFLATLDDDLDRNLDSRICQ